MSLVARIIRPIVVLVFCSPVDAFQQLFPLVDSAAFLETEAVVTSSAAANTATSSTAHASASATERAHAMLEPPALCHGRPDISKGIQNLRLVHITKTGGTALEKWGASHGLCWGVRNPELRSPLHSSDIISINGTKPVPMYLNRWHVPPRFFASSPYKNHTTFAVVRNPYDRVISEFRCPFFGFGTKRGVANQKVRAAATKADLNRWLMQKLQDVKGPQYKFAHLMPQYLYIFTGHPGRHAVVRKNVLHMESLQHDFAQLLAEYSVDDANSSGSDTQLRQETDKDWWLTNDPLPYENGSDMKKFSVEDLEPETIKLVNEIYALDFVRFGYKTI